MIRTLAALFVCLPGTAIAADFAKEIQPLFAKHCVACHGPEKQKGGLRLDRKTDALRGGDSGRVIVPRAAAKSLLYRYVAGLEKETVMPPEGPRLTAAEVAALKTWIEGGAIWPDDGSAAADAKIWWSFQPVIRPTVPAGGNPIDAFVRAKLAEKGLAPSPEADRQTLARRLYFDLIGLPPTPEDVDAFIADRDPKAYEKLVDRLLASPRYGERWARHWLDVVHYGDTHGYDKDKPRPNAWPYRDYVIRSFNDDKPYTRFVREQVAGDVLYPGTRDGIEALGFLAAGPWDFIGHAELPESKIDGQVARHLDRDDVVANTVNTFLSLTVQCAQCHNHKFDPISQEDYYSLQAVFAAIDRADKPYDYDPAITTRRAALTARYQSAMAVGGALATEPLRRAIAAVPPPHYVYAGTVYTGSGTFVGTGAAGGKPRPIFILARGNVTKPGKEVGPGGIESVPGGPARFTTAKTDGQRRAALANWLTDKHNPFVWRSIVNRVWLYHFGRGIVDTPNDFGRMGQRPTHPELLDWLACEFRDNGQSLKRLHKLIVTSATYRQASTATPAGLAADAGDRFYARQTRRKLDAEAVRDSILAVAGRLDLTMYGPGFQDFVIQKPEHSPHYEYQLADPDDSKAHRRAVYRFVVRSKSHPFLAALDCADPSISVDKRTETITPQQALAQLNDRLVLTMARHFAARVKKLAPDPRGQVAAAFRLATARHPTDEEIELLTKYAVTYGMDNACRVILNLSEFAFVD
ncbi:MAG TPA: PSD1 and planctomycete cytochrome C domain-containing protein [Fimbriiglobus sp.]|jgi:mono/diheme cytochrome c family protein